MNNKDRLIDIPNVMIDACRGRESLAGIETLSDRNVMAYLGLCYLDMGLQKAVDVKANDGLYCESVLNFTEVLNGVFSEGVKDVRITKRYVRKQDDSRIVRGEHPGTHIGIVTKDDIIVHMNLFGGIRSISCMDDHDTVGQFRSGRGQANRTDKIERIPLVVNMMVQPEGGDRVASCQLTVNRTNGKTVSFDRATVYRKGRDLRVSTETRSKTRIEGTGLGEKFIALSDYLAKCLPDRG